MQYADGMAEDVRFADHLGAEIWLACVWRGWKQQNGHSGILATCVHD